MEQIVERYGQYNVYTGVNRVERYGQYKLMRHLIF